MRPWRLGLGWLAFLAPFFFATYGFANWWTSRLPFVPAFAFEWERAIPFLPWTILPYWTEDLFYAGSLFLGRSREELDRHALRLVLASLISVVGFLLFPLRFSFERPATHGAMGTLFTLLGEFDKPFNQAPSLHISLLVILWARYARHVTGLLRRVLDAWFALIGISVLTTYQHHVIDVVTGIPAGIAVLYALPDAPFVWRFARPATARHVRLALAYALGALACSGLAVLGGWAALALWPGTALALVAAAYGGLGPSVFQKRDGRLAWPARALLLPYLAGRWLTLRMQARALPPESEVMPGLRLGTRPRQAPDGGVAVLDLTAELPAVGPGPAYAQVPMLDLVLPSRSDLAAAVQRLDAFRREGRPVLVHCALGLSRSAVVVAAWLLQSGLAADPEAAAARLRAVRPGVVLHPEHLALLRGFAGRESPR